MRFDAWGPLEIHNTMGWEGRRFGRSVAVPVRAAPPPRRTYIDVSGDFADFGL